MRLNEELIESHTIYRGRVVTLRIDTVRLPNGNTARREIVEHRGAVAIVPLLDRETLLEIPAGTLEPDEPPDACARRELQEETGYTARQLRKLFSQYLAPGYSQEVLHVYLAEDLMPAAQGLDADEMVELVPTPLREVERMILEGEIKDSKTIAGLLMTLRLLERAGTL